MSNKPLIALIIFSFILCTQVISYGIRLDWWRDNGCASPLVLRKQHEKNSWALALTVIYILACIFYLGYMGMSLRKKMAAI